LLHDLAREQRMLQRLLQDRMLLDQLGRGLRILQGLLQKRVHLQELLGQDRVLQDGLQQWVLLQVLAAAVLLVGALRLPIADAALSRAELLQHALLQDLMQHRILLHDLAGQQWMLQCLLQQRVLLDQLGCGLRVLQCGLQHGVRLQELLRQGGLLQDGLEQGMQLQELAGDLLALGAAAHVDAVLRLADRATGQRATEQPTASRGARWRAERAAEVSLRLELLLSKPCLFISHHVLLHVVESAAGGRARTCLRVYLTHYRGRLVVKRLRSR
jgi:hypothetical protein